MAETQIEEDENVALQDTNMRSEMNLKSDLAKTISVSMPKQNQGKQTKYFYHCLKELSYCEAGCILTSIWMVFLENSINGNRFFPCPFSISALIQPASTQNEIKFSVSNVIF